jgi:7-cyano-7-deazaguanine synthase
MLAALARRYRAVHPVFIRQGLVWEEAELHHLRWFLHVVAASPACGRPRRSFAAAIQPLTVLQLPVADLYGAHWSVTGRSAPRADTPDKAVYLPGRNLLLLSKAAVFCARQRIRTLVIGSLGHNPFPDATEKFFRDFSGAGGAALGHRLKIAAPFRSLTKDQVIRRGVRLGLPLHLSFSCISPRRGRHCGRCNKCAERRRAFHAAGVVDKTKYSS